MVPFPSDYYTVPDPSMPSGRRVDFPQAAMPVSTTGVPVDPASWERNDGFSPGSLILAFVPGLDLATSGIPGSTSVEKSLEPSSPIVLLDANTMKRLPYWAELDIQDPNPATRLLVIHPAANLPEGDRIIVALRNLKTSTGTAIAPSGTFAKIVSGTGGAPEPGVSAAPAEPKVSAGGAVSVSGAPASGGAVSVGGAAASGGAAAAALVRHEDHVLATLKAAGIGRKAMFLAWDFTVESTANLTGWALHMRNAAFGQLGSGVPAYHVTSVTNFTPAQHATLSRQVIGTFDVPSFLNKPGGPQGSVLHFGPGGEPTQIPGNVQHAVFSCLLPRSADPNPSAAGEPVRPAWPVLYGKGLFSVATQLEVAGVRTTANRYDLAYCSTNWMGLDGNDELADAGIIENLSTFATIPDRLVQSMIDALFLGRLMSSPKGFAANPAFESAGPKHTPLIDTSKPLVYYGNSEGSLMGGAVTALSTQIRRAVLGVPSMDYAILLPRSVDFAAFYVLFDKAYPSKPEQQVILDLLQMLWDRGETDGYAENMTTHPLPGTPTHQVLLQMGFGDHQVANVSTEIEARTIGARVHRPVLPAGLSPGHPFAGTLSLPEGTYQGPAALYLWYDTNVLPPPAGDVAPSAGPDPHDTIPRSVPAAERQLVTFLETGKVIDVCGASPCVTTQAIPPGA